MKYKAKKPAILLLQDGKVFHGKAAGKIETAAGEICFNTGMTGYQEIFTDPSYFGQLLITTHVHIGNYGIHSAEVESESVKIAGLICKSFNVEYSRKDAMESIQDYFEEQNIVAISDVDTRAIVRYIRSKGAMNAVISSEITDVKELKKILAKVPSMEGLELSSKVSAKKSYLLGNPHAKFKVAALDLGVKKNILRCLNERDCYVQVFPMGTKSSEILKTNPDGLFISNGPGDPAAMPHVVETISELIESNIPMFGICLGHQVISLANGIKTYKMFNGHRGINHPVKNLITGKDEVTSQNHGFAVDEKEAKKNKNMEVTHLNLNDGTIEGIRMKHKPVFCVQYHPEASAGPHDSRYLFDDFVNLMQRKKNFLKKQKSKAEA
ncbi:MAG: glutamine-hydrolyzing carbamoyl-phosphate synthase small subunit [Bacteroidetes bacterium]|nr:glutamine-hydrolyzing carbamoyl-phosphate synthase small subunit [Bacteroidota bacterium]